MALQETEVPGIPYRGFVKRFLALSLAVGGTIAMLFTLLAAAGLANVNINTDSTQITGLGGVLIVAAGLVLVSALAGWLIGALSYNWISPKHNSLT